MSIIIDTWLNGGASVNRVQPSKSWLSSGSTTPRFMFEDLVLISHIGQLKTNEELWKNFITWDASVFDAPPYLMVIKCSKCLEMKEKLRETKECLNILEKILHQHDLSRLVLILF
ncbi:hypothetical protein TNIN_383691 [Trichonephila inaurata madagascariensis]|uniref:Uncharacterized protein n=1 Tax=Trichonephila inaurata madagascariensis TaxID=2747483 RepID=A0A8X6Y3N1_9ARAC|nr:hypothetical protein TNIN_383691 [Trichonephila inaurata madagascariensis]